MSVRAKAHGLSASVAGLSAALALGVSAWGGNEQPPGNPTQYGAGDPAVIERLLNSLGHFTIWSCLLVCIVSAVLALKPEFDSMLVRVLRLDAVLMITITAIVYALVIGPHTELIGLKHLTNPMVHIVTPLVAIAVWFWLGPRQWVDAKVVALSLLLPLLWVAQMLVRGAITGKYPYDFCDAAALGYPVTLRNLGFVLVFGLVVAIAFWGVDRLLSKAASRP